LVALLLAALLGTPLVYLVVRNLGNESLWATVSSRDAVWALLRTLALAAAVSTSAAVLGTATAWMVVRTDLPLRRVWAVLLPLPLVIPSFIGAFALTSALAPGGLVEQLLAPIVTVRMPALRGFVGAFVVLTLLTYPYVYLPVVARLGRLPRSFEESARLLGASPGRVFRTVVLPQARGAIAAGTLLVFLYTISEFGAVQIMRYDALTRTIYETRVFDPSTSLALSLELGVLALLVVAFERTALRRGRGYEPASPTRPLRTPLRAWKLPATLFTTGLVTFALLGPVAVLTYWATRGLIRGSTSAGALATDLNSLVQPTVNTALAGIAAAVVAVVVVLPIAFVTVRHRSAAAEVANGLVVTGFALPGLAIALALVTWTLRAPAPLGLLYQTLPLLVLAYVVHFGAQALRASQVGIAGIPRRMGEAARSLGATRWQRLRTIDLPLALPGLAAGGGLVLLSVMKELPATLLLAPAGFQTLATRIWSASQDALFADASIAALVLIVLSGVLTWVLVVRRAEAEPP